MGIPKFNWWQMKALFVLTPLSLQKLAQQSNVDFMVLADTATLEKWERLKNRYKAMSEGEQNDLHVIDLLLDCDDPSKQQFVKDVLKRVNDAKSRTTKDVVKDKYAAQLSEFGMTQREAQKLLDEYDRAVNGAPDSDYGVNADLSEREQLDIINAGYAMISRGLNSSLYKRIQSLEKKIEFWERMIDDMHQKYIHTYEPAATFEQIADKQRPISYAAQSLVKLLDAYAALTGIDKYVDVQSSLARLRSMGYHCVHDSQLQQVANK